MALIAQKFGGSSVADRDRIFNVANIVKKTHDAGNDVVVVVSAQGDTTDDLIAKAAEITKNPSHREMDMLLASGEEISIALLAMALTPTPDLLVLDEPVSGVDQNGLCLFLDTVSALKKSRHMAILLISHDWSLVRRYADTMVLLNTTVLCEGTPDTVFGCETFREAFPAAAGKEA